MRWVAVLINVNSSKIADNFDIHMYFAIFLAELK